MPTTVVPYNAVASAARVETDAAAITNAVQATIETLNDHR
jgi:hypothetical protein